MNNSSYNRAVIAIAWLLVLASVLGTLWIVFAGGSELVRQALLKISVYAEQHTSPVPLLAAYLLICFVSQLLVIPSGSIILVVSGFIFGAVTAAGIFSLAQVLALYPVYRIAQVFINTEKPGRTKTALDTLSAGRLAGALKREGLVAGIVLRLAPVVPSAAASCLAALLTIPLKTFFFATVLVCWVRPLFFASVGGALKELSNLRSIVDGSAALNVWPLLLVFIASLLVLGARLWLYRQQR